MILKGSQRAGAAALAAHLLNEEDNDHVAVLELHGFMADDLHGALREAHAISKATRARQYLFSLSLSPPPNHAGTEEEFREAVQKAEAKLGLDGQPRAIILHEKEGRRHAHVVWSRIDAGRMRAINLPHFRRKLTSLSKELYLEHGWDLPKGLQTHGGKSPLNFTLAEWQQARRQGIDPREIKTGLRAAVERSDTITALGHALRDQGFALAKGDRRGFVVVDLEGHVYALPRWAGLKAKEMGARFGSPDNLPSVEEQRTMMRGHLTNQMKAFIAQAKAKQAREMQPLIDERKAMVRDQRAERALLKSKQAERRRRETDARAKRLRSGLSGLMDRVTGRHGKIADRNAAEAWACALRDQDQRDGLVMAQIEDRKALQCRIVEIRARHKQDRTLLARQIGQALTRKPTKAIAPPPKALDRTKPFAPGERSPSGPTLEH